MLSKPALIVSGGRNALTSTSRSSELADRRACTRRDSGAGTVRRPGFGCSAAARVDASSRARSTSASSASASGRRAPGGGIMPARSLRIIFSATSRVLDRPARRRTPASDRPPALPLFAVAAGAVLLDQRGLRLRRRRQRACAPRPSPASAARAQRASARQNPWPASAPPVQDRARRRPRSQRLTSICSCGSLFPNGHTSVLGKVYGRDPRGPFPFLHFLVTGCRRMSPRKSNQNKGIKDGRTASTGWRGGAAGESLIRKAGQRREERLPLPKAA